MLPCVKLACSCFHHFPEQSSPHLTLGDVSFATAASAARNATPGPRVRRSSRSEQPAATLRSAAGDCGVAWEATSASVLEWRML